MNASTPPEPDTHARILELHAAGDRDAVARILEGQATRLERCVRLRMDPALRSRIDEADVVQETMMLALDRIGDWLDEERTSLFLWLRFLAIQRLLQLRRHHVEAQCRDARREFRLAATSRAYIADVLVSQATSPSSVAGRRERKARVLDALEALPAVDREILELRCLEDLSNVEVAEVLEMNPSSVSTRFLRALKRVRRSLDTGEV